MSNVRHVLGISGGKDSAALAVYLFKKYPRLNVEYYTCDTGKELDETYRLIENLEVYLGKEIRRLRNDGDGTTNPFDYWLQQFNGYLPSSNARWCTKYLKLKPFESYIGDTLAISYVGIRGDEDREGYISRRSNIQSIFPFRRNIWSEDVMAKFLSNANIDAVQAMLERVDVGNKREQFSRLLSSKLERGFILESKRAQLLDLGTKETNRLVFEFLKTTSYPLAHEDDFPLVEDEDVLVRKDIFAILEASGVGVPGYYKERDFESNGNTGKYARSRSGCFFCFFQQKIEWVWLLEQYPERFAAAMEYEDEKAGFTWNQKESLRELMQPARVQAIKAEYLKRTANKQSSSSYLLDILGDAEAEGCAACFI